MNKINIGIFAHVDAGKTTISEQFLYKSGHIKTLGRVDQGNACTDNLAIEKKRGITVKTTTVSFKWHGSIINLLDTPGHVDFIAEVERSMMALDGAVLAISAREGIQAQTRVLYNTLKKLAIPTIIYINKVDRFGVNLDALYKEISLYLSSETLVLETVKGAGTRTVEIESVLDTPQSREEFFEKLCLFDDDFMSKYLEGEGVSTDVAQELMQSLFREGKLFPVLHGSALHGIGVESLLNVISNWVTRKEVAGLSGRVYKVDRDSQGQRRCFVRLFGGLIKLRDSYDINSGEKEVKVRQMGALNGMKIEPVDLACAGDIVVIYSNELNIEDIFGTPPPLFMRDRIAEPTLKANVKYQHLGERKAILNALEVLTDEDPFLDFSIHPFTEAIEVKLFGVVQREILIAILKERFDIETEIENPATLYKERPLRISDHKLCMYKDTFLPATVGVVVAPLALGSGFQYENKVSFGDLKKTFQNGVYEGIKKGIELGPRGWPLTDLKVTFNYSEYDSVNSTPSDYRNLAPEVIKGALEKSGTELLEPLLKFELQVPHYAIGRAISDVLKMKGETKDPYIEGENANLEGILPVETSKNYHSVLADYTEGKGILNFSFYGYRPVSDS